MVLPVGRRSVRPANGAVPLPGQTSVAPRRRPAAAPGADDVLRLVIPDRHVGPDPEDEPAGEPSLSLGPGPRARVLRVPPEPALTPFGAEVPVEVDTAAVHAEAEAAPVRVQAVNDPEVEPRRMWPLRQSPRDLDALALVPVDAADDEHRLRAREVAVAVRANRPPSLGVPDYAVPFLGSLRRGDRGEERCGEPGCAHGTDTVRARAGVRDPAAIWCRSRSLVRIALATLVLALVVAAAASAFPDPGAGEPRAWEPATPEAAIVWRDSRSLGRPSAGRLVHGVRLPAEGADFFTWDPALDRVPNRGGRRWGTDRLVRVVLEVDRRVRLRASGGAACRDRRPEPAPRRLVLPHARDPPERARRRRLLPAPRRQGAAAGARLADRPEARPGPRRSLRSRGGDARLRGPEHRVHRTRGVVRVLWNHDNHLHVRIGAEAG